MFFDEAGWGRSSEPRPKRVITPRQERIVLWLLLANMLLLLIAPIGGGTVVEGVMALFASLR
jgi:hypothetical protein